MSSFSQVGQFAGNAVGGLITGQGFDTSRWPGVNPQQFVKQQAEAWKPLELIQPSGASPEQNTIMETGDRQTNALLNYANTARQQNKQDAQELLAQQNAWQRSAAQEFTLPALAFKGQMDLLKAMASREQQPINGLAWLPDPKNQVFRPPSSLA